MKKIRVLQVVQTLDIGGLERVIVDLIRFSNRDKFHFSVCCLSERGVLADELERDGIEVVSLNKRNGADLGLSVKIAGIIRNNNIDILHTHNQRPELYGAFAACISRAPVFIHTRHGRNAPDNYKSIVQNRFSTKFINKIVCVSEEVKRFALNIEKLPARKLLVVRNGIDIGYFSSVKVDRDVFKRSLGISPEDRVIGIIARLATIKNHKLIMSAFKDLKERRIKAKLLIVGDGPLREELIGYSQQLGLVADIIFLGSRSDTAELLSIMDVFALSSLSEGISLVLLEAIVAGVPIVATDVGGNSELIKNGENGFLIPSGNSPAMSKAIFDLLADDSLRKNISENNRIKGSREFNAKTMCDRYMELYESELGRKL